MKVSKSVFIELTCLARYMLFWLLTYVTVFKAISVFLLFIFSMDPDQQLHFKGKSGAFSRVPDKRFITEFDSVLGGL